MEDKYKSTLLQVAAAAVKACVAGGDFPEPRSDVPELNAHCGCFVTLKNKDRLRGCIGQFVSDRPLVELIAEMARLSTTNDPRFYNDVITASELDQLDIEISVLSPLQYTKAPLSLRLGIDGIYIKKGYSSGCFLPQVATEAGWTKEEFLSYCCDQKAGLPEDAWKDPETEVYLFTAEIFGADFKDINL